MTFKPPWRQKAEKIRSENAKKIREKHREFIAERRHRQSVRWAQAAVAISLFSYLPSQFFSDSTGIQITDHVEQPTSVRLQDSVIRLVADRAYFAMPIVYEEMLSTLGADGAGVTAAELSAVEFAVN